MNKIITLLILNLLSGITVGQEKFIELEITDTIMCKADIINYMILVQTKEGEEYIEKYLERNEIHNTKKQNNNPEGLHQFDISFSSGDEIELFYKQFRNEKIIFQSIPRGKDHVLKEEEIDRLYAKILAKGDKEVEQIARAMKKDKVELVEVKYKVLGDGAKKVTYTKGGVLGKFSMDIPDEKNNKVEKSRTMILKYSVQ